MEMPQVTEAHKKVHVFAGRWSGDEKVHPSPFDPKGGAAVGRVENRVSLDGMCVLQDYEQKRDGQTTFRGIGVFRFDAQDGQYHLHWFDSFGMAPSDFTGGEKGGVWSFKAPSAMGGFTRCSFDFRKPGAYAFEMAVSQDGKQWFPFMEGNYRKS